MKRDYYSGSIDEFLTSSPHDILGQLAANNQFELSVEQRNAWEEEIRILKGALGSFKGKIFFEYSIPRMGSRVDVILIVSSVIFVLEFKIGKSEFTLADVEQVEDYAADLKNFHEPSHKEYIVPILIASDAKNCALPSSVCPEPDKFIRTIKTNGANLSAIITSVLHAAGHGEIDARSWAGGRYSPTPTIVEAAVALYRGHSVSEISRSDASATNLSTTSSKVREIINYSKENRRKSICFVTGVPGAGKTLVGLNIATRDSSRDCLSVFLSGNGPLVAVLREALVRDAVAESKALGKRIKKSEPASAVKQFIQIVHHFRDECIKDPRPPEEHVAIFDEAQRAWNKEQTANFMRRKKNILDFDKSEPHFLISCLDRHEDWATVVCLVGGGQEIHTGEAGIGAWVDAIQENFPEWDVYLSSRLTDSEYEATSLFRRIQDRRGVQVVDDLHLAVSMRSFRAESVSNFVKALLDLDTELARESFEQINSKFPIFLTRDLGKAKAWLRSKARGSERYGLVAASSAERLKPHAINVKTKIDPIHYFLNDKSDVRSSYYLEDAATEFDVQGLELDWACLIWDADLQAHKSGWKHREFKGSRWQNVNAETRRRYQLNAYRVLLTRARQGMVIVVPPGDPADPTRAPEMYDPTYEYLKSAGVVEL